MSQIVKREYEESFYYKRVKGAVITNDGLLYNVKFSWDIESEIGYIYIEEDLVRTFSFPEVDEMYLMFEDWATCLENYLDEEPEFKKEIENA